MCTEGAVVECAYCVAVGVDVVVVGVVSYGIGCGDVGVVYVDCVDVVVVTCVVGGVGGTVVGLAVCHWLCW